MHRGWVIGVTALVTAAGCGRVGFELAPPADAEVRDGDAPIADGPLACPALYEAIDGGCYRFEINPLVELSWLDAEAACEADGAGAHLLVIDDAAELTLAVAGLGGALDAWIGLSDRATEGVFRTVTDAVPFTRWAPGEPSTVSDCVQVKAGADLDVRDCLAPNDYLCEYDGRPAVPAAF